MSTQFEKEEGLRRTKVGNITLHQLFTVVAMTTVESPTFYMGSRETEIALQQWAGRCIKIADTIISELAKRQ